jgi:hypothetical protein
MNHFEQGAADTDKVKNEQKLLAGIHAFISENGMKPEDVEAALFREIDAAGNSEGVLGSDDLVSRLSEMLAEAECEGVPFNEITGVLHARQLVEAAPKRFLELVDRLHTDERSKNVLLSVVERGRVGSIMFLDPESSREIGHIELPPNFRTADGPYRAQEMIRVLTGLSGIRSGIPFEVSFEEA